MTAELLRRFEENSKGTSSEVLDILWSIQRSGKLELLLKAVVRSGQIGEEAEAWNYLCHKIAEEFDRIPVYLTQSDFKGKESNRLWKKIREELGEENNGGSGRPDRWFGTLGHSAVSALFAGELHNPEISSLQLDFWKGREEIKQDCRQNCTAVNPNGSVEDSVLADVKILLESMQSFLKRGVTWEEQYHQANFGKEKLAEILALVFGEYVNKVIRHKNPDDPFSDYLILLTLMSWGESLLYYGRENTPKILFREIDVLKTEEGNFGGRCDALEVFLSDRSPNSSRRKILQAMARNPFPSVGHLVRSLQGIFPRTSLGIRIWDWKFFVGDAVGGVLLTEAENLSRGTLKDKLPLRAHIDQVAIYLTLSRVSVYYAYGREVDGYIWREENNPFGKGGLLHYISPIGTFRHPVRLVPDECARIFSRKIAGNFSQAQLYAHRRLAAEYLAKHALELLRNDRGRRSKPDRKKKHNQLELAVNGYKPKFLENISGNYIRYLDPDTKIAREAGVSAKGKVIYLADVSRLLRAIDSGRIETDRFTSEGGFIRCLNPEHNDINPSMHVSFTKGLMHCFSCKTSVILDPDSAKGEIAVEIINSWRKKKRAREKIEKQEIPARHAEVMQIAQNIFSKRFAESPGWKYVAQERQLNPDLALTRGAGFAEEAAIGYLLDAGISLEELIFYGFISFSNRLSGRRGLYPLLKNFGFKHSELIKEIKGRGGEVSKGFPFFALNRRVTFPLMVKGKVTNFYGRAVPLPNGRIIGAKHYKLSQRNTHIRHGAFNMDAFDIVLKEDEKTGFVTESSFKALAMEEMGFSPVIGIIGAGNSYIMDWAAESHLAEIAIALDDDETGWEFYHILEEQLRFAGFAGRIFNFSRQFFACPVPTEKLGLEDVKDYDEWWKTIRLLTRKT